ncbi:hypothetical protein U0070_002295, partial [Myodes glareolus]
SFLKRMEEVNQATVAEVILAWIREKSELQLPLFLTFLGVYIFKIKGNLGMIILIPFSAHLHTPVHNLLSSLSFIDCGQSTVNTPNILVNVMIEKNVFLYPEFIVQFYFLCSSAVKGCHNVAVMTYDCSLSYSNTFNSEVLAPSFCVFSIVLPVMTILHSYIFLILSLFHIQSTGTDPRPSVHELPHFVCCCLICFYTFLSAPGAKEIVICVLNHCCACVESHGMQIKKYSCQSCPK